MESHSFYQAFLGWKSHITVIFFCFFSQSFVFVAPHKQVLLRRSEIRSHREQKDPPQNSRCKHADCLLSNWSLIPFEYQVDGAAWAQHSADNGEDDRKCIIAARLHDWRLRWSWRWSEGEGQREEVMTQK